MPAYVVNGMEVTDPDLPEDYRKLSPAAVAQFGGRFLARGGAHGVLEGDSTPKRPVTLASPEGKTLLADPPNFTSPVDPVTSVATPMLLP